MSEPARPQLARRPTEPVSRPAPPPAQELVVLSGKGGSGKTSVTAALAHLAHVDGICSLICDLDVDAPDLHILLRPRIRSQGEFVSGHVAQIDPDRCLGCGLCGALCRFGAIGPSEDVYEVSALACEGCRVCVDACPAGAIDFEPRLCGEHMVSETRWGSLVHAQLLPGQENSGRLVSLLRKQARALARKGGAELVLADGAPGIGCPVIAALTGSDLALLVAEPSPSGLHDLERVAALCEHFGVPAGVVVNRHDLYPKGTAATRAFAKAHDLPVLGEIPVDLGVVDAQVQLKTITECAASPAKEALVSVWNALRELLRLPAERAVGSRGHRT